MDKSIFNLIPLHPQCRCIALPVIGDEERKDVVLPMRGETPFTGDLDYISKIGGTADTAEIKKQFKEKYNISFVTGLQKSNLQSIQRAHLVGEAIGDEMLTAFPSLAEKMSKKATRTRLKGLNLTEKLRPSDEQCYAMYSPRKKHITTFRPAYGREDDRLFWGQWTVGSGFKSTIRHEYAHHIHETLLTPKQKKKWLEIYTTTPKSTLEKISRYGSTNELELFAESLSAYTSPKYTSSTVKLPEPILQFITDLVGERKP